MRIQLSGVFVISVLSALASVDCAQARLRVITTLPSIAEIAGQVGGEEVEASSMTKGNQDPHFVDAKPDYVLRLNRADLLIRAGLGLEDGWLPPLMTGARNGRIQVGGTGFLDLSAFVELRDTQVPPDRSQGDVHAGGNPHYMADPRNGIRIAEAISDQLSKIDPAHASDYRKRADRYESGLKKKITEWEMALKPYAGLPIVTYHRSWIYFSSWAGLNEVGYVEPKPGIPPSPSHTAELVKMMRERKVGLILAEPYYPTSVAEQIARETGAKLLVLPLEVGGTPEANSYGAVFDQIIARIKAAVAPPAAPVGRGGKR